MQFVDEAVIEVIAGQGGSGMSSFRREAKVPFGGPDGGNGGRGGDVVVVADPRVITLLDHRYQRVYAADPGKAGASSNCTGASASPLEIPMPLGTVITDQGTDEVLADLTTAGQRVVLAAGGRGGRGNATFATSTRQAPRRADPGKPGERRQLRLTLKLMADVGLVGLPNAGKSTFLRSVSNSQAEVAAYPFTTLTPNLGLVQVDEREFVMADIPGLIEGAHTGRGLGGRFLRHVERTRVLVHLVSLGPDAIDPLEAYRVIRSELAAHAASLAERPEIVVLTKQDLIDDPYEFDLWKEAFAEHGVVPMISSAITGLGVKEVLRAALNVVDKHREPTEEERDETPWSPT